MERREPLKLAELAVRRLRNLEEVDLVPGPRFNVFAGDNGQGKTNLLEAIYLVATSKSFRASRPGELVAHGGDVASARAVVEEGLERRTQVAAVKRGARMVRIDGKRPPSLAAYAVRTPVVVFHPGESALSMGSGGERRRLLDRVALYVGGFGGELLEHKGELESYARALVERQKSLEARGVHATDLDTWEELVVRHGTRVMRGRREAATRIGRQASHAFGRIATPGLALSVTYVPGAPEDPDAYRAVLRDKRPADLRRGAAHAGPHRDDLRLAIGEHGVRGVASQGQHRAVVLALKSAEVEVVAEARGVQPILLLDDVSSELDVARTAALFQFLREQRGQVFLTTTRAELIDTGPDADPAARRDFAVVSGRVTPRSS